jgi:hypothetical protein
MFNIAQVCWNGPCGGAHPGGSGPTSFRQVDAGQFSRLLGNFTLASQKSSTLFTSFSKSPNRKFGAIATSLMFPSVEPR